MFDGCSSLSEVDIAYTGNFTSTYFGNWLRGVDYDGTMYYAGSDTTTGSSAIPSGWTVETTSFKGLTFTARTSNSSVTMGGTLGTYDYSVDGRNWSLYTKNTTIGLDNVGDKAMFRARKGNATVGSGTYETTTHFTFGGEVVASGNILSLLYRTPGTNTAIYTGGFNKMFENATGLVDAENLILPSTTLADTAYQRMFNGCSTLEKAPLELPATTGTTACYGDMFAGTAITKSPYIKMTSIPSGASWCWASMFKNCSNLTEIKVDYTGNWMLSNNRMTTWVDGVAASGTFYYNGSDFSTGTNAIPSGWTVQSF